MNFVSRVNGLLGRCVGSAVPLLVFLVIPPSAAAQTTAEWSGILWDGSGKTVSSAEIELRADGAERYRGASGGNGAFSIGGIAAGSYEVSVKALGRTWKAVGPLVVKEGAALTTGLQLVVEGEEARVLFVEAGTSPPLQTKGGAPAEVPVESVTRSGGQKLSSTEVSSLPLNERDFSKLLLLAAGTMTDTNGAANFTQQFSVNGQRGSATVFAMDGADTTDPELGGATFSNFNVDAIQEVQSSSGVMPAEIGHGAAGFNNVITKSGTNDVHGSAFEFIRNAAFDARNFFDHQSAVNPRRIPPFARNEFGVTNGGPLVLPKLYDGRSKTFYFAEYQGFRQVLGTTQVFPVPTAAERQGIDTTTFPGDTLTVPVNPAVVPVLKAYPLPNEPRGPFGN